MSSQRSPRVVSNDVAIATNNGDIGGGEVMMLRIAEALRTDGFRVTIVAPSAPSAVAHAASAAGHAVAVLKARNRIEWMLALRSWDRRKRTGILWCNGLVPATATVGHPARVVHLHQRPEGVLKPMSLLAQRRAQAVIVPSQSMLVGVPNARVVANWTMPFESSTRVRSRGAPFVVGFLGRVSTDKGTDVLAQAMRLLDDRQPGEFRLLIGGESRFVPRKSRQLSESALYPIVSITDRPGWVEPGDFFNRIDLLVVPSVWAEPFGLVAAEAMAARVPVLVSDAGALPEVVGENHPLVVPAGDALALADAIANVAAGHVCVDVSEQHRRWSRHFSPEAGARRMQALMADLRT